MAVNIQLRRDPAATWVTNNPLLLEGEMGIETDTKKYKLGDGVHQWNSLAYAGPRGIFPIAAALEIEWDENYPSNYSELTYDSTTGKVTAVRVYSSSAKTTQIFSKLFSYDGTTGKLSSVVISSLTSGSSMTKTLTYNVSGKVVSVDRTYTA